MLTSRTETIDGVSRPSRMQVGTRSGSARSELASGASRQKRERHISGSSSPCRTSSMTSRGRAASVLRDTSCIRAAGTCSSTAIGSRTSKHRLRRVETVRFEAVVCGIPSARGNGRSRSSKVAKARVRRALEARPPNACDGNSIHRRVARSTVGGWARSSRCLRTSRTRG